jgi:hypothetical protein
MYGLMGELVVGLMEIRAIGLVDGNIYLGINNRKGEFMKGRFVRWTEEVASRRDFVDMWKG